MSVSLKHSFASAKGDGTDPSLIQPSNWNAEHVITCAADSVLGRTGTSGAVLEISCTAFGRSIIASVDAATARTALDVPSNATAMPKSGGTFTGAVVYASSVAFGSSGANLPASAVLGCGVSGALVYGDTNYLALRGATGAGLLFQRGGDGVTLGSIDNSGNFTAVGNVAAYSDERIKTNWQDLDPDLITKLAGVKVGTYERTDFTMPRQVGVSAQSLETVMPEAVNTMLGDDGIKNVAYGNAALAACVALCKEVVALRERIAMLEAK